MRTRVIVLTLCVCVCVCVCVFRVCCLQFTFNLYIKYDIPVYFSPVFLVLNFVDFDKKPSLSRKSVFHGYFVVYSR